MPNPMMECHALLTQLGGGGVPDGDMAQRVETIVKLLQRHSADDLIRVAELLDSTAKAKDRTAALVVAKAEVAKLPAADAAEAVKGG